MIYRAVARTLIAGCIFIYSGVAQLTSFEINFISKETSQAELEYMNIHPPINALATALVIYIPVSICHILQIKKLKHNMLYKFDFSI